MISDLNTEMIKGGSSLPEMTEYLRVNGWITFRHHDNWVHSDWSLSTKERSLLSTHDAYYLCRAGQMSLPIAMGMFTNALKKDTDWYNSFKANIAMAFKDEFDNQHRKHAPTFSKWLFVENGLHEIANTAADNFLQLLLKN